MALVQWRLVVPGWVRVSVKVQRDRRAAPVADRLAVMEANLVRQHAGGTMPLERVEELYGRGLKVHGSAADHR